MGRYFNPHVHSNFSALDGMTEVSKLVERAVKLRYPALALTDHGNMAGATALYTACKKAGIVPFPGVEAYIVDPMLDESTPMDDKAFSTAKRYHLGMLALNSNGYNGLVRMVSRSHTRPRFNKFPRLTVSDLLEFASSYGNDIAITTGCFFGFVQQSVVEGNRERAQGFIELLANGYKNTFIELQHHNIDHTDDVSEGALQLSDDDIVAELVDIADELGLPVLAAGDNHYLVPSEKSAHALMKQMVYGSVEDAFPGDSFHLPSQKYVLGHYDTELHEQILQGHDHLLSLNTLEIPALDKYRPRVPTIADDAQEVLVDLTSDKLDAYLDSDPKLYRRRKRYEDRLVYELNVINQLGQANYMLLWDEVVKWCRDEGICIEARGSGNGSLVNFLIGITQVDPIRYKVTFDRFLSVDRIKPPDIDMDIEDLDRQRLITHLKKRFTVTQIGTWLKIGTTTDNEGEEKGSVLRTFVTFAAREAGREADEARSEYVKWQKLNTPAGGKIARDQKREEELREMDRVAKEDRAMVYQLIQSMRDVKNNFPSSYDALRKIVEMDSVYKSYGVHAAGLLLSGDDLQVDDWIPTMLVASSNTTVTQPDMDAVEQWGLLKLDVLGQRSLRIMKNTQKMIGRDDPTDFTWIPEDDPATMKMLSSGQVGNGVFHAEGWTKAKGFRQMRPRTVRDIILGTALFMPGAMDTGQTDMYLQRRFDREARESVQYPHDVYADVLGPTYGALVFQEQTISIMRQLGVDMATINMLFKIVKDSGRGAEERNRERIKPIKEQFFDLCNDNGVTGDPEYNWTWITGIVAYAFNQAHATGYGIRTYRSAYLKVHHPLEFHSALLEANAGTKKEEQYIVEVMRQDIPMLPPDVNVSGANWTRDERLQAIRKGLLSIPGVGATAAAVIAAHAPYVSVIDLATRANDRSISGRKAYVASGGQEWSGTMLALRKAGALNAFRKAK